MALSAAKTFVPAEVLYASDLNALNTNILDNPMALISPWTSNLDADGFDLADLGELEFRDESADPTADGRLRRNGDTLTYRLEDARTNTTARPFAVQAVTSGTPAASLGVGIRFDAESADENPSNFGALDFVATDVTAGSEDTVLDVLLRVAGAALSAAYRFVTTTAFRAIFTHANSADRTYTLPDATTTLVGHDTTQTLTNKTITAPVLSGTATGTYTLSGTPTIGVALPMADKLTLYNNAEPTDGQILIGDTAEGVFDAATITAGTGISVTNGAGSVSIATTVRGLQAWVHITGGGTPVIADSFNVTSIADDGTGLITITWDTDFATAAYAMVGLAQEVANNNVTVSIDDAAGPGAGSVAITLRNSSATLVDADYVSVLAIGDQ